MIRNLNVLLLLFVAGLATEGCKSTPPPPPPPPGIQSQPAGAEVWIRGHGTRRAEGGISGFGRVKAGGTKFEDKEFVQVGLTPCDYHFPGEVKDSSARIGGLGGTKSFKNYRGGTVQIRLPGYKTWERKVPFGRRGDRLMIDATLEKK